MHPHYHKHHSIAHAHTRTHTHQLGRALEADSHTGSKLEKLRRLLVAEVRLRPARRRLAAVVHHRHRGPENIDRPAELFRSIGHRHACARPCGRGTENTAVAIPTAVEPTSACPDASLEISWYFCERPPHTYRLRETRLLFALSLLLLLSLPDAERECGRDKARGQER